MELYQRLTLPAELIQNLQVAAFAELDTLTPCTEMTRRYLTTPKQIFGDYLAQNCPELPPLLTCMMFYREGGIKQPTHIDSFGRAGGRDPLEPLQPCNCAVNIPLLNCSSSAMQWYQGEYQLIERQGPFFNDNQGNWVPRAFLEIVWNEGVDPVVFDEIVIDQPTLIRISQPHSVSLTHETRMCLSFRFLENVTFEEVAAALTN
jgi:hypothetical protein